MWPKTAVDVSLGVAAVLGALVLVWRAGRAVRRAWRRVADFLDDWNGEEARPGHERRPSMPERIATLERDVADLRLRTPNPPAQRRSTR